MTFTPMDQIVPTIPDIAGGGHIPTDTGNVLVAASASLVARKSGARPHLIPDVVSDQVLIKLHAHHSARDAAMLMDSHQVSSVLIVDINGRLSGIFTQRDFARRLVNRHLNPDKTRLSQVMTNQPTCIAAIASPEFALHRMQDGQVGHLPITDDGTAESEILGIVSKTDLLRTGKNLD